MKTKIFIKLIIIMLFPIIVFGQQNSRETILKAMKDEMSRNISKLSLENLKKPFFISYNIHDFKILAIKSSLGAIIQSNETPYRNLSTRVIVGDYKRTQENYFNMEGGGYSFNFSNQELPLENDYDGIRRVLWKSTDDSYKSAAESYESKISALKQQKLTEEELALNDFCAVQAIKKVIPTNQFKFEKEKWEKIANELSSIFDKYKDIFKSEVTITFLQGDELFVNSEGAEVVFPITLSAVQINAVTQAEDGEPLNEQKLYYELLPESLPDLKKMKEDITNIAENIIAIRKSKPFSESYTGPVLFEGQAMGELISQRLFGGSEDLMSVRKQIYSNSQMAMFSDQMGSKSIEDKIGKKIFSDNFRIKANPKKSEFDGKKLIGSFQIDFEGVEPADELLLVENGTLKTLLNGRIPIPKVETTNGHNRFSFNGSSLETQIAPGVIEFTSSKTTTSKNLKKKLIETAQENGLEYAIIVRKLKSNSSGLKTGFDESSISSMAMGGSKKGMVSKPIAIYKVYVSDGREELVRNAELGSISLPALKKVKEVSDKQLVYNTLLAKSGGMGGMFGFFYSMYGGGKDWYVNGVPTSFIIPDGMIIDELEVQKAQRIVTPKLPIVENPVGK